MKVSALEAALNVVWAMEEQELETLLAIAGREHDVTLEALEAYQAKTLERSNRARTRDGVAILDANGALFKRANLMTALSGATSYSIMRADLQAALDDPSVRAIMLNIDSPGGEASGAAELSAAIYEARGEKPIVAYVNGRGASAAYWIASAADRIVVDPTAVLGSIGVQAAARVPAEKAGDKVYRFVSSQSPRKNPDLGTEEGNAQIQSMIDATAEVFVADVARNRGVATETVLSDFGQGGIFVGQQAIEAGLADSIGSFESVLAELSAGPQKKGFTGVTMADETNPGATAEDNAAAIATAVAAAVAANTARIGGLRKLARSHGATEAELDAAIEGDTTVEAFALALADKAETAKTAKLDALKNDEEEARKAAASTGAEPTGEKTADQVAQDIVNAVAAARGEAK